MLTPARMLEHADAVKFAYECELKRRNVERKLDRLDRKVAAGHTNLTEFRGNVAAELEGRASVAYEAAKRRAYLEELAETLVDPFEAKAA